MSKRRYKFVPLDMPSAVKVAVEAATQCEVPMTVFYESESYGWRYTQGRLQWDHPGNYLTVLPPKYFQQGA